VFAFSQACHATVRSTGHEGASKQRDAARDDEQTGGKAAEKDFNAEVRLSVNSKATRQVPDEAASAPQMIAPQRKSMVWDFKAQGELFLWLFGGGLCRNRNDNRLHSSYRVRLVFSPSILARSTL
jgi:hypothetical protein